MKKKTLIFLYGKIRKFPTIFIKYLYTFYNFSSVLVRQKINKKPFFKK